MTGQDLRTLIEAPHRRPANIARNAARHPVETLEFFGLAPDLTVLEILPAFGWYTEILAPYLADEGLLYVAHFSPDGILPYMPKALEMYEKIARRNPEVYGKVTVRHINPPNEVSVAPPESVDLAMTFRNVHNWIMSIRKMSTSSVLPGRKTRRGVRRCRTSRKAGRFYGKHAQDRLCH